jgi:hypothetical protein
MSQEEKAKMVLDDLADRLPEQYDMEDIRSRVDEVTPYVMVAIQVGAVGVKMTSPRTRTKQLEDGANRLHSSMHCDDYVTQSCFHACKLQSVLVPVVPLCVTTQWLLHAAVPPCAHRSLSA